VTGKDCVYVGVDWGGTNLKVGLVSKKGEIIEEQCFSSQKLKEKTAFLRKMKEVVTSLGEKRIRGVGIGVPGIVNMQKGFIYYLPNIRGWENFPLRSALSKSLGLPVFVDNDANLFALAEGCLGVAKGKKRAIILTLGTGLGGAVILGGRVLHGQNSGVELGHIPIASKGKKCSCGARGCIETFVGNRYLSQRYKKMKGVNQNVEIKEIFSRASQGEREAQVILQEFAYYLGKFLRGMVNVFNPEIIVLGGGISGAFRLFKPLVWQVIREEAMWPNLKGLKLVKAKLKNPGIIGAALLVKENLG